LSEIVWPDSLIREVADRRCILFLGSGVSASAQADDGSHPKTWGEFLIAALGLVKKAKDKAEITKHIEKEQYLLALEAIEQAADQGDYSNLLNNCFNTLKYKPGELHKIIYDLDARIVVTTNFDKIYEQYWTDFSDQGFKVVNYDDEAIGDEIRSDNRLIIKSHGSINNVHKMIFTRAEYHEAKSKYPSFYEILRALFLTNTAIFIGCGMQDPDLLLTLEEVKISSSAKRPHYALLREGATGPYVLRDLKKSYNVQALEYGPDHDELTNSLATLLSGVESIRAIGVTVEDAPEAAADLEEAEDALAALAAEPTESPFPVDSRVSHAKFGGGTVTAVDGAKLTVQFDSAGQKMVISSFVEAEE
jgi:hypothetical protein